jgi:hypothetical protein
VRDPIMRTTSCAAKSGADTRTSNAERIRPAPRHDESRGRRRGLAAQGDVAVRKSSYDGAGRRAKRSKRSASAIQIRSPALRPRQSPPGTRISSRLTGVQRPNHLLTPLDQLPDGVRKALLYGRQSGWSGLEPPPAASAQRPDTRGLRSRFRHWVGR